MTLNGIERVTLFDKGETVQRLRYLIMQTFSDLGLDGYPAGCMKIMEREDTSGKYTKLPILLTLCRDVVVTVKLPETLLEKVQVCCISFDLCPCHFVPKQFRYYFPWPSWALIYKNREK